MKFITLLLLALVALPGISAAQKNGLINSGELITNGAKLHDSGEYKKALSEYNKISRSDTNYVRALYEKAISCDADSQYTQAIKYCQEALALKEQREYEPEIYNTYGNTLNNMGKNEQALKIFDAGIAKYPAYSLLYFNKGITQITLKNYAAAEELFKQTLLINPYMYSAHYHLGITALQQGKIIPAFLSFTGYLLITPEGRYAANAIGFLSKISKGTDDVIELKNKRAIAPSADYQAIEEIVLSKIALDKQYKPIIALDDQISRQMQVIFEKLDYNETDPDFWTQYYLPYYKQVFKAGQFELFVNHSFSSAKVEIIQNYNKKNKKELDAFVNDAGSYFNLLRATREIFYTKRDTVSKKYIYDSGKLVGKGLLLNNGKTLSGWWQFLYPGGNLKSTGNYDGTTGKRDGAWKFYTFTGNLKSVEYYKNGDTEGGQDYYHDNGNPSAHEIYLHNLAEGLIKTYYFAGNRKAETNYKLGKKDGEERLYYWNSNLKTINHYAAGVLSGVYEEYYKSGKLREAGTYANGKLEGPYKRYFETGGISADMQTAKDVVVGEWKSYYENGQLKEKRNYTNNLEDGLHQEYHENGKLSATYNMVKGKINGNADFYDKEGNIYAKFVYDNSVVKSVKYFNSAGTQLSASVFKNNAIDVTSYVDGVKKAHFKYDQKGNIAGLDTVFFPSGRVNQINEYKDSELNGPSVTYHLNGKKKSEINVTAGKENGYYQSYYTNGQTETEGWIRDGENQGEWIYYNQQGAITTKLNYLDSELNGYKEEYYANGRIQTESKYNNGLLEKIVQYDAAGNTIAIDSFPKGSGKYKLIYPKGQTMEEANYVNGNFNGAYKTYYFDSSTESSFYYHNGIVDSTYSSYFYGGQKHSEGLYKNGKKYGTWKTYEEDGSLYCLATYDKQGDSERIYYNADGTKDYTASYKDDLLNGLLIRYDPDGTVAYQITFEDDNVLSYTYLGKDGKLLPHIPVVNGRLQAYFPNGKPSRDCTYTDGVKNGEMKLFYNNGQLRLSEISVYGILQGPSTEYYPNGKLKEEQVYDNNTLNGAAKEFYSNGVIKKETIYLNGLINGPEKYYNTQGKLIKTLLYDHDKLTSVVNEK